MQEYQLSQQCTDKTIILFIYCRRKTCRTVHQKVKKTNFYKKKIIIRLNLAREWLNQVLVEFKRELDQRIQ